MCKRVRLDGAFEIIHIRFGSSWAQDGCGPTAIDRTRAYGEGRRGPGRGWAPRLGVMAWDVLGGSAKWPMTNVRNLALPQWRRPADKVKSRCLTPITEFCEWTPDPVGLRDVKKPVRGESWFAVPGQPIFAIAALCQQIAEEPGCTMVTNDPNRLVAPIHPETTVTILHEADWERWLRSSYEAAVALQRPYPADLMTVRGPVFPKRQAA